MIKKVFYTIPMLAIGLLGCAKEENLNSSIPFALVKIDIQTQIENQFNDPYYSRTYTQKGYTGYGGVIAISSADVSNIYAYDMCCPYEAPNINIVAKVPSNPLQVQCPKCGTIYNIANGTGRVQSGPGTERLKSYRVIRDGYYYRIRN